MFVFITGCVASATTLGIRDPLTLSMFAVTWVCGAVERVMAFRKGVRPALKLDRANPYAACVLIAGAGPWVAMRAAQAMFPSLAIWTAIPVSSGLYAVGLVLAAASIAEPLIFRSRSTSERPEGFSWQLYREGLLRSAAILLLTGSPMIATLCVLWLALTLWSSSPWSAHYRAPRPVRNSTTDAYFRAFAASSAVFGGAKRP